jgi:hypothetical protein
MTARLLLEVLIRVLGLWYVVAMVSGLAAAVFVAVPGSRDSIPLHWTLSYGAAIIVQGVLGVALLLGAPRIARRFYGRRTEDAEIRLAVGPGDVYRIACFVLGVYLLVQTAEPASRFAAGVTESVVTGMPLNWQTGGIVPYAIMTLVYGGAGVVLVFGSERFARLFFDMRDQPGTDPKMQASQKFLLWLVLGVCLALGVARCMALRGH